MGHQEGYRKAVDGPQVFLHLASAPEVHSTEIATHEVVQTLWEYMRDVVSVDQAWLFGHSNEFLRVGR